MFVGSLLFYAAAIIHRPMQRISVNFRTFSFRSTLTFVLYTSSD